MAKYSQVEFQDASSTIVEELIKFHEHAVIVALAICSLVLYFLALMLIEKLSSNTVDAQEFEPIWTILPAIILVLLTLPSLQILYITDEIDEPDLALKAICHQWYRAYEYTDFKDLIFKSYITPTTELPPGHFRLLEVDHHCCSPYRIPNSYYRHCRWRFTVLSNPLTWRKNWCNSWTTEQDIVTTQPGIFYGQCSEICRDNHSYMPFVVESTPLSHFRSWSTLLPS